MEKLSNSKYYETLYDDKIYKRIKSIIKSSRQFIKYNKVRRRIVYEDLKNLSLVADYTNIFRKDFKIKELEREFNIFQKNVVEKINEPIKRVDSADMSNKMKKVIEYLIDYFYDKGYIEEKIDYKKILKKVNIEHLYFILISISVSSLENIHHREFQENFNIRKNEVSYQKLVNKTKNSLILILSATILDNNSEINLGLKDSYYSSQKIINESSDIIELTLQLLDIFEISIGDKSRLIVYNDGSKVKSMKLIQIPEKVINLYITLTHIPEIVEPFYDFDDVQTHILNSKRIKNGISTIELSEQTKRALRISEKKEFKINRSALDLFKKIDSFPYEKVKDFDSLPFTPLSHLKELEVRSNRNIPDYEKNLIDNEFIRLKNEKESVEDIYSHFEEKFNISNDMLKKYIEIRDDRKEFKKRLRLRRIHNTVMMFAEIFEGYPIYFTNTVDYRLRMYPFTWFFNRTSGIYKYLLIERDEKKITRYGIEIMKKASKGNYLLSDDEIMMKENSSFFYHILLKDEIKRIEKGFKKTGFMVEIDQKSSSTVLMSIILGDLKLAKSSNIGIKDSVDPSKKLMHSSFDWYKGKISDESLKILSERREPHKFLLMCFHYNQTYYGRLKRIQEYISNGKDCNEIAKTYQLFIDDVFDKLSYKKDKLNKIIKYYLENSENSITINTIDGSKISWNIYKVKQKNSKKKYKSPTSDLFKSYDSTTYDDRTDIQKSLSSFLPSFIHSIDGSIMRLLIIDIFESNKYIINHLHDSISFHPNYYDQIIKSIENVYYSNKIDNLIDNALIDNLRNNLLDEKCDKFDELVLDFKKNYQEVNLRKMGINVKAMFPFE